MRFSAFSALLAFSLVSATYAVPFLNDALNTDIHARAELKVYPEINFEFHSPSEMGLTPVPDAEAGKVRNAAQLFLKSKIQNFFKPGSKGTVARVGTPKFEGKPHVDDEGDVEFVVHLKGANGQTKCGDGDYCHVKMKKDGSTGEVHASSDYGPGEKIVREVDSAW